MISTPLLWGLVLSDALLHDNNGQYVVDANAVTAALSARLGVQLTPHKDQIFLRGHEIGGFNRKWGLPLPQSLAVQMGSVFVYDPPACGADKLRELETQGIGERRAEGFGRVAINWHGARSEVKVDTTPKAADISPERSPALLIPGSSLAGLFKEVAKRMAERLLRQRLDEQLIASANGVNVINPPSNAQLSRLRNIIHHELMQETPNPQHIGDFLDSVRRRATARKQFERAHIIGGTRLLDWLDQTRQKMSEGDWQSLWSFDPHQDMRAVGGVEPTLTDALRAEYVLRFIDAVLARAIKKSRKEA